MNKTNTFAQEKVSTKEVVPSDKVCASSDPITESICDQVVAGGQDSVFDYDACVAASKAKAVANGINSFGFHTWAIIVNVAQDHPIFYMPDNMFGLCTRFGIVFSLAVRGVTFSKKYEVLNRITDLFDMSTAEETFQDLICPVLCFTDKWDGSDEGFLKIDRSLEYFQELAKKFECPLWDGEDKSSGLLVTLSGVTEDKKLVFHVGYRDASDTSANVKEMMGMDTVVTPPDHEDPDYVAEMTKVNDLLLQLSIPSPVAGKED